MRSVLNLDCFLIQVTVVEATPAAAAATALREAQVRETPDRVSPFLHHLQRTNGFASDIQHNRPYLTRPVLAMDDNDDIP